MTVGHCLRDHGTETKNNFDRVTRSLNRLKKIIIGHGDVFSRLILSCLHCDKP